MSAVAGLACAIGCKRGLTWAIEWVSQLLCAVGQGIDLVKCLILHECFGIELGGAWPVEGFWVTLVGVGYIGEGLRVTSLPHGCSSGVGPCVLFGRLELFHQVGSGRRGSGVCVCGRRGHTDVGVVCYLVVWGGVVLLFTLFYF